MSLGTFVKNELTQHPDVHGQENVIRNAIELVRAGKIPERELSFRSLAEGLMGSDWADTLQRYNATSQTGRGMEVADAVDASAFVAISGNQLIDKVYAGYNMPGMIGDQIFEEVPVTNSNLDTQKEPWLSSVKLASSDNLLTSPGMEFRKTEYLYNYFLYQRPQKRAHAIDVLWETIYADRTKQAHQSATSVGEMLKLDEEKRKLRVFLGITNNFTYAFASGSETSSNTYIETDPGSKWVNQLDLVPLVSWNDINQVEQLFAQMRDPVTGEPIEVNAKDMFVMPAKMHLARSILNAEFFRLGSYAVTAGSGNNNVTTQAKNPLENYNLITSKHAYKLAALNESFTDQAGASGATITASQANDLWLMGDFKRAFYYRRVHPLIVRQVAPGNRDEVMRDVVLQISAKEFGVAGVKDPRFVVRVFGHAQNAATT